MSYWVVKGRPNENDLVGWIHPGGTTAWATRRPPRTWAVGDSVFIWEASPTVRFVGLATITDLPQQQDEVGGTIFVLQYTTNYLLDGPDIHELRRDPALSNASFLKAGAAGTVFPLSDTQAARILDLLSTANAFDKVGWHNATGTADTSTAGESAGALGGGFGSVERNRLVERVAVDHATALLEAEGWLVVSREANGIGYDLHCSRGSEVRHVEIKGTASAGDPRFILTHAEHRRAHTDPAFFLYLVSDVLSSTPQHRVWSGQALVEAFTFSPLQYLSALKAGAT